MIFGKKKNGVNHHPNLDTEDLSKVGNILFITGVVTKDDLNEAIEYQLNSLDKLRVGEILVKLGKITEQDLEMAIEKQIEMRKKGAPMAQILHDLWRINFNKTKESVRQRQISIDTVDMHMRKVGC